MKRITALLLAPLAALRAAEPAGPARTNKLDQSPCALNIVDVRSATCFRLTLFNDTSHYSDEAAGDVPPVPQRRLSGQWSAGLQS